MMENSAKEASNQNENTDIKKRKYEKPVLVSLDMTATQSDTNPPGDAPNKGVEGTKDTGS